MDFVGHLLIGRGVLKRGYDWIDRLGGDWEGLAETIAYGLDERGQDREGIFHVRISEPRPPSEEDLAPWSVRSVGWKRCDCSPAYLRAIRLADAP